MSDDTTLSTTPVTLETLSESQLDLLVEYFHWVSLNDIATKNVALRILYVLTETRPCTLIEFSLPSRDHLQWSPVYHLITELDLPHTLEVSSHRWFAPTAYNTDDGTPVQHKYRRDGAGVRVNLWVASDPAWLAENISAFAARIRSDSDIGTLLGFPDEAVEAFEEGHYGMASREHIDGLVEEGVVDEQERAYLDLTSFVPAESEEGVQNGIARGKEYYRACEEFDALTGTSYATAFADEMLDTTFVMSYEEEEELLADVDVPDPIIDIGGVGILPWEHGPRSLEYVEVGYTGGDERAAGNRVYEVQLKTWNGQLLGKFLVDHAELDELLTEEYCYDSELEMWWENPYLQGVHFWR